METVNLWELENLFGMIVRKATGFQWSNQVGGTACSHPVVEGIFIPLPREWFEVNSIENDWGHAKGEGDLKAHNKEVVKRFLDKNSEIQKRFVFDEDFNGNVAEAWVPLKVKSSEDEILKPFFGQSVVVTYENSD